VTIPSRVCNRFVLALSGRAAAIIATASLAACGWTTRDDFYDHASLVHAHDGDGSRTTWDQGSNVFRSATRTTDVAQAQQSR
jgi:hypothetical protein